MEGLFKFDCDSQLCYTKTGENMNLNNVFAFGNKAQVIMRFASGRNINGVAYAAQQPYTIFDNVEVSFRYEGSIVNADHQAQTAGRLISTKRDFPVEIFISNITLNSKLSELLFDVVDQEATITRVLNSNVDHLPATFILSDTATNFFFFVNGAISTNYIWDTENKTFTINDYDEEKEYLVFYKEKIAAPKYHLASPHNAYFTLEVFSKGNKSGELMNVYINLAKCALLIDKQTDMAQNNNTVNLVFSIIEDTNNYMVFE